MPKKTVTYTLLVCDACEREASESDDPKASVWFDPKASVWFDSNGIVLCFECKRMAETIKKRLKEAGFSLEYEMAFSATLIKDFFDWDKRRE